MYSHRNVAIVDIDEYISSRGEGTSLLGLLSELDQAHPDAASYRFICNMFFVDVEADKRSAPLLPFPPFLSTRAAKFRRGQRTKTIVKPLRVIWSGHHALGWSADPYHEERIADEVAALFHFRHGDPLRKSRGLVQDEAMLKYESLIQELPLQRELMAFKHRGYRD
jgi:hypothetical protein